VIEMTEKRMFSELQVGQSRARAHALTDAAASAASADEVRSPRELPDVTGFLVVVIVALGLFVVPVGATILQGPAIVASLFAGR
jgi:hypothetical protein